MRDDARIAILEVREILAFHFDKEASPTEEDLLKDSWQSSLGESADSCLQAIRERLDDYEETRPKLLQADHPAA